MSVAKAGGPDGTQSCPWVGLTHGLGWVGLDWVGLGPNFSTCKRLDWVGSVS